AWTFALVLASSLAHAAVVEHTFNVEDISVQRLCRQQPITAVNGTLQGPTINAREGDTIVVYVFNKSPCNLTLHWHGIIQFLTPWSDGPEFVTQCPIPSGGSYTYKFNLTGQEGTLWWHAHSSFLRATVYGALLIRPRLGHSYPFPKVYQEVPIIIGEWWNANVVEVEHNATESQTAPIPSAAYTINGLPGYFCNCSESPIDALYTQHYKIDVVVLAPGQTVDVLFSINQPVGSYYMAFTPYHSAPRIRRQLLGVPNIFAEAPNSFHKV
ncbi:Laccase-7, partial [Glycine soja]